MERCERGVLHGEGESIRQNLKVKEPPRRPFRYQGAGRLAALCGALPFEFALHPGLEVGHAHVISQHRKVEQAEHDPPDDVWRRFSEGEIGAENEFDSQQDDRDGDHHEEECGQECRNDIFCLFPQELFNLHACISTVDCK